MSDTSSGPTRRSPWQRFLDWVFRNPSVNPRSENSRDSVARTLLGFPGAGEEKTRVRHPHEPGQNPRHRDQRRRHPF